jgi:hypothetical protein
MVNEIQPLHELAANVHQPCPGLCRIDSVIYAVLSGTLGLHLLEQGARGLSGNNPSHCLQRPLIASQ